MNNWSPIIPKAGDDPWELAMRCNALYECPKDASGKRLGPLVPYAGKDAKGRNLVGDVYFNFARIEEYPLVVHYFAELLMPKIFSNAGVVAHASTLIGIPDGGRSLGQMVALVCKKRFVYPAKVKRPTPAGAIKEEDDLVFKRFELSAGEPVIVCDDVHNNFQNTDDILNEIGKTGAKVVALCSGLNRSPIVDSIYVPKAGMYAGFSLPVVSAIRKPLLEYEQDDPAVAADFSAGNIERNVKANWAKLKEIMLAARGPAG